MGLYRVFSGLLGAIGAYGHKTKKSQTHFRRSRTSLEYAGYFVWQNARSLARYYRTENEVETTFSKSDPYFYEPHQNTACVMIKSVG